ncbi:YceI family protein [Streptomyces indicus]|uniref:Polyisoprenoid-binding protein YceI n=1 Tax=Streptomyces indicus TaxID=417292 RepID=A0A1G9ERL7_9ACTN|nr:YceI family protein [Streptomyces indicus]SDK78713.1 Polyisoprenoid-binding protein YceI [Streptomyces indicus]
MGLTARIRTGDGWAVEHAVVTLTDMRGEQVLRAGADADGVVRTEEALRPGPYTAIVTAVGYAPHAATALVTASGRAELGTVTLVRQGGAALPPPGRWTIDPAHSTVAAVAQHLGISSVRGRFTDFSGTVQIAPDTVSSTVEATLAAASIDTGNALRDKHLRSADFLDVDSHPSLVYRGTSVRETAPGKWTVHGTLALRGIVREVPLELTYSGTSSDPWGGVRAGFRATATLHREDFAMHYNQIVQAGVAAIGATLQVELDIQLVREEVPVVREEPAQGS